MNKKVPSKKQKEMTAREYQKFDKNMEKWRENIRKEITKKDKKENHNLQNNLPKGGKFETDEYKEEKKQNDI